MSSKNIYPDVIRKAMPQFDIMFKDQIAESEGQVPGEYEKLSEEKV